MSHTHSLFSPCLPGDLDITLAEVSPVEGGDPVEYVERPLVIVPGSRVLVTPKTGATKSSYSLDLVDIGPSIVGVNPMLCNKVEINLLETTPPGLLSI